MIFNHQEKHQQQVEALPKKHIVAYILDHLNSIGSNFDFLLGNYGNNFLMCDLTCDIDNVDLRDFCNQHTLKNLFQKACFQQTCFKNETSPTCIVLMLTNACRSFQNSCVIETG